MFVAVAEHLNFTRAADALGVTASAASLQIRALEEYLSRPLFCRDGRQVHLTHEGASLLPRVQQALTDIERAVDDVRGHPASRGSAMPIPTWICCCRAHPTQLTSYARIFIWPFALAPADGPIRELPRCHV